VSLLVMRLLAQAGLYRYAVAVAKAAPVALWCWVRLAVLAAAAAVCRLAAVLVVFPRVGSFCRLEPQDRLSRVQLKLLQAIAVQDLQATYACRLVQHHAAAAVVSSSVQGMAALVV
jgi:hypothetical protein